MNWLIIIHLIAAAAALSLRSLLGRRAFLVGALGPMATLVWAAANTGSILGGSPSVATFEWIPSLDLTLAFRVDTYSLVFLYVIGVAGTAIFLYAARYFGSDPRVPTFAGVMTLFGGAMVGLVTSDHLLSLFVFWELTTITSYLLIGYDDHNAGARSSALHAALVTGSGGLAMLGGLVLLGQQAGTFLISEIVASPPPASTTMTAAFALMLVGAVTKSAQFPFHGWLPGAMAAPTPASAFLHSATMVKAGIFLVGRFGVVAVASTGWWQTAVLVIGFATMVVGGWQALRQDDLKLLLAYGTVSQLGFIFLLTGSGSPKLVYGGLAVLAAHALFKATLFMVVGTIDHEAGTRDLRRLSGLRRTMPALFWVTAAAAASMAAVPLTVGFAAKEAAFDGLVGKGFTPIALAAGLSILTVVYTGRFLIGAFGPHRSGHEPAGLDARSPKDVLLWSPMVLAVAGLVFGLVPQFLAPLVDGATIAATGVEKAGKFVVWPGLVPALFWSFGSLGIGAFLIWRSRAVDLIVARVRRTSARLPTADGAFLRAVAGVLSFADRSSGLIQNGSLPTYIGIIALVAVVLPSTAFVRGLGDVRLPPAGGLLEVLIGLVIVVSAIGLLFAGRRFAAVLLLGGVGFGVAGLFALFGGPDLALTQLLVETLAVALFAIVLRHMPAQFRKTETARVPRMVVAAAVGLFVFVGGLLTVGTRSEPPVSEYFLEESVPTAAGENVVNVILVDFRALDTLGELTVLVTATLGVSGLVIPVLRQRRDQP
jgi:multicomponent Na+:H+ antiporter subunit A